MFAFNPFKYPRGTKVRIKSHLPKVDQRFKDGGTLVFQSRRDCDDGEHPYGILIEGFGACYEFSAQDYELIKKQAMFTTSCFIRKNTPELRAKLEELGYERYRATDGHSLYAYTNFVGSAVYEVDHKKPVGRMIDCDTNEALFLALAALRDDSDYLQWFTDGDNWEQAEHHAFRNLTYQRKYFEQVGFSSKPHKATPAELIEHFTKQ